ncbi:hypothetical protein GWC77_26910 [Paraburkholderia sp. NMBU_R16]|nr:hypothetical protein [Paraburkholderia sp. NMBU_R16]
MESAFALAWNERSVCLEYASLDIKELMEAALALPPQPLHRLNQTEHWSHFSADNVARHVSIWARSNMQTLRYNGGSTDKIAQEVAALDAKIKAHREEAAKCQIEILKQAGGFQGMQEAMRVGMEPQFDNALRTRQKEEEAAANRLKQDRESLYRGFLAAQAHDRAKAEAIKIIGALVGALND